MNKKLLIATRNKDKFNEIVSIFNTLDKKGEFELFDLNDIKDLPNNYDVEESGSSYEENAILKAKNYGEITGLVALADDSGLEVDVLNGQPGIRSARYVSGSYKNKCKRLLDELKNFPDEKRKAKFVCVMALYNPVTKLLRTCRGDYFGRITKEIKGRGGFGYDPIFYNEDLCKTNSEMRIDEKNKVSHRRKALEKCYKILKEEFFK